MQNPRASSNIVRNFFFLFPKCRLSTVDTLDTDRDIAQRVLSESIAVYWHFARILWRYNFNKTAKLILVGL